MSYTDEEPNQPESYEGLGKELSLQEKYDLQLQEEKAKYEIYREALKQEFANLDVDDPETQKKVRAEVHTLIPLATATISQLLEHAESESVRANLAKWVLSESMKTAEADKPKDFVSELFDRLKNDSIDGEAEEVEATEIDEHSS